MAAKFAWAVPWPKRTALCRFPHLVRIDCHDPATDNLDIAMLYDREGHSESNYLGNGACRSEPRVVKQNIDPSLLCFVQSVASEENEVGSLGTAAGGMQATV